MKKRSFRNAFYLFLGKVVIRSVIGSSNILRHLNSVRNPFRGNFYTENAVTFVKIQVPVLLMIVKT